MQDFRKLKIWDTLKPGTTLVDVKSISYLIGSDGLSEGNREFLEELGFELKHNVNNDETARQGKFVLNKLNMIMVHVENNELGIKQDISIFDGNPRSLKTVVNHIKGQLELAGGLNPYEVIAGMIGKSIYVTYTVNRVVDTSTGEVGRTYHNYDFINPQRDENEVDDENTIY